ncbi:hypothetical protein DH2020_030906 [Rehmannia glutinosa]|uniref:Retrotransposon gag domain-containing protein n=1 Tax=Rehmannia glutinosa TaxID=99300 RepID=A0ABR0VJK1_REHGL
MNGVPDEAIRLRLFPFSLRDKALDSGFKPFHRESITSWNDLTEKFMAKFFPPSKTLQLKKVQYFYNGMNGHSRTIIDLCGGGTLMAKTPSEAMLLLEEMAANSYQWPSKDLRQEKLLVLELDTMSALASQISALSKQIATLSPWKTTIGGDRGDKSRNCESDTEQANYVNNRGFNNRGNQLPTHYHPGLRNHENFSYSNTRNVLQPPPGYQNQASTVSPSGYDNLEGG